MQFPALYSFTKSCDKHLDLKEYVSRDNGEDYINMIFNVLFTKTKQMFVLMISR